ncbi:hypothetical protein EI94DRAFT_1750198 [Lactarius quietus]|nr:hypothetical protein EI94DRAFT_1750198 [Lactarius quietus]
MKALRNLSQQGFNQPLISTPLPPLSKPSRPSPSSASDFFYVIREVSEGGSWYEAHNPMTGARGLVPRAMFESFNKGAAPNVRPFRTPPHKPIPSAAAKTLAFYARCQSNREWFVAKSIGRLGKPGLIPAIPDVGALMDNGTLLAIALGVFDDPSQTPATPATSSSMFHEHLPHRPPSPTLLPDGLLLSASVVSFHREMDEYWFRVHALYQPFDPSGSSTLPPAQDLVLFRAYNDFFDYQTSLLDSFPREGGREGNHPRIVPFMPGPSDDVDDTLSATRQTELDDYLRRLCRLNRTTARYILEHHLTREFFALKPGDVEKETDPQYDRMADVGWYEPSDPRYPFEKFRKTGLRSNGARHSDSEGSDYGDDSEAIAASSPQRQRSRGYSTSRTKLSTSGQSVPVPVGHGNGYSATASNGQYRDSAYSRSSASSSSRMSPLRSSAGGSTRSGRVANGTAGPPVISASNPHTAFIKIKVFDRVQDDLIAIRVHPRVTHGQLLDKVQQRLGGQVGRLSYRESGEDGEDYVPLQQDDDVLWWIGSTEKHVLYAD